MYADPEQNRKIVNAASQAHRAAYRRLRESHEGEFQQLLAEEKAKRGLGEPK